MTAVNFIDMKGSGWSLCGATVTSTSGSGVHTS